MADVVERFRIIEIVFVLDEGLVDREIDLLLKKRFKNDSSGAVFADLLNIFNRACQSGTSGNDGIPYFQTHVGC